MQTQRGIIGRGKMDIEGVIEYEGRWSFSWEDSRWQSAEQQLVRKRRKLWKMGSGKIEMRRSQIEGWQNSRSCEDMEDMGSGKLETRRSRIESGSADGRRSKD